MTHVAYFYSGDWCTFTPVLTEGTVYTEKEVNAILVDRHTFGDHVLLRRELIDFGLLSRSKDCSEYAVAPVAEKSP